MLQRISIIAAESCALAYYLKEKGGNARLAASAGLHDPVLILGAAKLARFPLDAPDQLFSGFLRCSAGLVCLRSGMASMNRKSSVAQAPKSVWWALTSYNDRTASDPGARRSLVGGSCGRPGQRPATSPERRRRAED